jgi:hypothetical protein
MKTTLLLKPMRLNAFNRSLAFTAMILGLGAMPATSVHAQPVPGVAMTGEPAMGVHEMHAMQGMQGMHPGPMDPARLEKMWQHRLERFDAHLERMKKRLELTPAQEGAWTQFASAIRPSKPGSVPLSPPQWRETMQLKAPERMEKMLAIHEARHAQMVANVHLHLEAVKAFYPQLSESQQSVFDKFDWPPRGKRASWQHP